MLKKFSVENFKCFKDKLTFDISGPGNYTFNSDVIKNGCITKGIIYGINGSGKTNVGVAIFDIITHLTDNNWIFKFYDLYLNLNAKKKAAEFEYVFEFDGNEVIYNYSKASAGQILHESLKIGNKEVISYDFAKKEGFTSLEGSDTLNASIKSDSPISRVKYVSNNSILKDNAENRTFRKFITFVNKMLMFYSLDSRGFEGFMNGSESLAEGIINSGRLSDFQEFLNKHSVPYNLVAVEIDGSKRIYCRFENGNVDFFSVASTGTASLALFYYWYIKINEASFVYIDEFDAFYHFELSEDIIRMLKDIKDVQIFTTTHNTDLLSNDLLRPDCYFILNDNCIKPLCDLTEKELREAHNLQKMYKAGTFNG